jgi:pyruvate dehydrogenase E2 component (dihydrolipoamide acetyltransferase)
MASKIIMPKLSDTMEEGTLVKWLKNEGDEIEAGEVIAEAESDKATMELESFDAGILKKIVVPEGGKVTVGGLLAVVADQDEEIDDLLNENGTGQDDGDKNQPESSTEPVHAAPVPDRAASDELLTSPNERIKASPLARKMADEKGIDLRKVPGTGTAGRIIRRDILNFTESASEPAPQKAPPAKVEQVKGEEMPISNMRAAIAKRMLQSKSMVPHFYLTMEINMDKAAEFRKMVNSSQSDVKISFNDLIIKAASIALQKHRYVNGSFAGDKIIFHDHVDIGVAVALEEGLITPVIRDSQKKSISQIAKSVRELAGKAKERKLLPEEYTGATFTISNLGMYGIEEFTAIINPPEAAILAVGSIKEIPVVTDGELGVGKRMKVTMSCDHRIVDGATGSLFLRDVKKLLENPMSMVI